jgi:predicted methyltransferase
MFKRFVAISLLLLSGTLLPGTAGAASAPSVDALLHQAVAGKWRSDANKARDQYRHPIQTLEFFGLKPDMTVVELSPGGGWYTEILAPVLRDHGQLIEAAPPLTGGSSFMHRMATRFDDKLKADPAVFGKVKLVPFAPPDKVALGPDNSADMVLTFRNAHDWLNNDPQTLAKVFEAAFKVLKHGGVFGVVEHRAKTGSDAETSSKALHRIPEAYLIALGEKTGFRLQAKSEINANPRDPQDINVHRLPPDLAGPDSEHAKMKAIGESDRMTLRFVKP